MIYNFGFILILAVTTNGQDFLKKLRISTPSPRVSSIYSKQSNNISKDYATTIPTWIDPVNKPKDPRERGVIGYEPVYGYIDANSPEDIPQPPLSASTESINNDSKDNEGRVVIGYEPVYGYIDNDDKSPSNELPPIVDYPSASASTESIDKELIDSKERVVIGYEPVYGSINDIQQPTPDDEIKCPRKFAYYKYEQSCHTYIECRNYRLYHRVCPDGMHFKVNPRWPESPCGFPSENECFVHNDTTKSQQWSQRLRTASNSPKKLLSPKNNPSTIRIEPANKEPKGPGEQVIISYKPIFGKLEPKKRDFECPRKFGYYRYKQSCDSYIECLDYKPSRKMCPEEKHFKENPRWSESPCAYPSENECLVPIVRNPFPTQRDATKPPPNVPKIYSTTPLPSIKFPPKDYPKTRPIRIKPDKKEPKGSGAIPIDNGPQISPGWDFECPKRFGYYRYKQSCDNYIECLNYKPSRKVCPGGKHFKQNPRWSGSPCGYPSENECLVRHKTPIVRFPTQRDATKPPPKVPKIDSTTPSPSIKFPLQISPGWDFECPKRFGYYRYKQSCDNYIECLDDKPSRKVCPDGKRFKQNPRWSESPCGYPLENECLVLHKTPIVRTRFPTQRDAMKPPPSVPKIYSTTPLPPIKFPPKDYPKTRPIRIKLDKKEPKGPSAIPINNGLQISPGWDFECPKRFGYYRYKQSCDNYIECLDDKPSRKVCPDGKRFKQNPRWSESPCGYPLENECLVLHKTPIVRTRFPTQRDAMKPPPSVPKIYSTTPLPPIKFPPKDYPKTRPIRIKLDKKEPKGPSAIPINNGPQISPGWDFECPKRFGYYRYKQSCDNYIECLDDKPSRKVCPDGKRFKQNPRWSESPCGYPLENECLVLHKTPIVRTRFPTQRTPNVPKIYSTTPLPSIKFPPKDYPKTRPIRIKPDKKEPKGPGAIPIDNEPQISSGWDFECSKRFGYYRYKQSCDNYIECQDYKPSRKVCPDGQRFKQNPRWSESPCGYPLENECLVGHKTSIDRNRFPGLQDATKTPPRVPKIDSTKPSIKFPPEDYPITRPIRIKPDKKEPKDPGANSSDWDFECPKRYSYYGYKESCDIYIECRDYKATRKVCPDGMHFKEKPRWTEYPCAYPPEAQCSVRGGALPARRTRDCPHQFGNYPISDSLRFADYDKCTSYLACASGVAHVMNCTLGLVFNPAMNICDWPEKVPACKDISDFHCPVPHIGEEDMAINYRYPKDPECRQFYSCTNGVYRLLTCDEGLLFDHNIGRCVEYDDFDCDT